MGIEVEAIQDACQRLRAAQARTLAVIPQAQMVDIVARWAASWRDPGSPFRRAAAAITEPFPYAMTEFSLDGLLDSLIQERLWELIEREHVRDAAGPPLIAHVIAGNTPLLGWVSLLRALLLRSASFVKLPSGPVSGWSRLFVRSLTEIAPSLAQCIHLAHWPGGTQELDRALCRGVDTVLAYGTDSTLDALRPLCPSATRFLGHGLRVSFGILAQGAPPEAAALGLARDVLLYDQGGCLSPQTVFIEGGGLTRLQGFARLLANALATVVGLYPPVSRPAQAALRVQEARCLARMEPETSVWEDAALRWTVIARPVDVFVLSPTHGVISIQPLADLPSLARSLVPVLGHLQGCALAAPAGQAEGWAVELQRLGVSRVCPPGELQRPPFSWREDGRDVLAGLLPRRIEDDQSGRFGQSPVCDGQS